MPESMQSVTKIGEGGRVVIPARFREALGMKPGEEIILRLEDGEIRLLTRAEALKRVQDFVSSLVPRGRSLVDELIRERREEAERE